MKAIDRCVVFRFDDDRVRCFRFAGLFELAHTNGTIFAHEQHLVEVPYVKGQLRRRLE